MPGLGIQWRKRFMHEFLALKESDRAGFYNFLKNNQLLILQPKSLSILHYDSCGFCLFDILLDYHILAKFHPHDFHLLHYTYADTSLRAFQTPLDPYIALGGFTGNSYQR